MNKDKALLKQCFAVAAGAGACLSGKIPHQWYEALTGDSRTAKALAERQERQPSPKETAWLEQLRGKRDQS